MSFYCRKISGAEDFSIDEFNKISAELEETNLSEKEKFRILFPPKCDAQCYAQCFDCLADVGERRIKTQKLINK